MAKVVVPAGTKVTTDRGDTGTLAQAWDGKSLRVVINSDKRGRIEVHPSNVYVNGRSLQDMAGGGSMAADASNAVEFAEDANDFKQVKDAIYKLTENILRALWKASDEIHEAQKHPIVQKYSKASSKLREIQVAVDKALQAGGGLKNPLGMFQQDAVEAVHFTAQAEASWKSWYDRRTATITVQEAQKFREALLELADKTENRALHDKAVADAQRLSKIRVDAGTTHAGMKPLWDIVERWPGVNAPTLKKVLYQWQDIAAGRA